MTPVAGPGNPNIKGCNRPNPIQNPKSWNSTKCISKSPKMTFCVNFLLDLGHRWPSAGVKRPRPGKFKKSEKGVAGPKRLKNESQTSPKPEKKNLNNSSFFDSFSNFYAPQTMAPKSQ